jgi:hypothetical protein
MTVKNSSVIPEIVQKELQQNGQTTDISICSLEPADANKTPPGAALCCCTGVSADDDEVTVFKPERPRLGFVIWS